jgi:hypothetical protein
MKSYNYSNFSYAYTGKYVDLESIIIFKYFTKFLEISNLNLNVLINNDFISSYILNSKELIPTNYSTFFLIYGINTKLENSLINLKLRTMVLENDSEINIYYIGNKLNLNYSYTHVGLTMITLLEIYYGANYVCHDIISFKFINFITGLGSQNDDFNTYNTLNNLFKYLDKFINYRYNNLFSSDIAVLDLNITSNIYSKNYDKVQSVPNFLYLFNYDDFETINLKSNKLLFIYQGHHYNNFLKIATVLIPSPTFLERNSNYIDCDGLIHRSNSIFGTDNNLLDFKILASLLIYIASKNNITNTKLIISILKNNINLKLGTYRNYSYRNTKLNLIFSNDLSKLENIKRDFLDDA